jgi:hypothetical protein
MSKTHALATVPIDAPTPETLEAVLLGGDLSRLPAEQRLKYLANVCTSLGLNPLTRPLEYILLSGKLTLYARKDATEQLRRLHGVSILELTSERFGDLFVVTAKAQDKAGRTDVATGAVALGGLKGEALANAVMKAETKAKRRLTLSICGLGILDESELASIPDARPADVDPRTGEIREAPPSAYTDLLQEAAPAPQRRPGPGPITAAQRKRLFVLAKKHGWTTDQLKAWLADKYQYASTSAILSSDYDTICDDLSVGPPAALEPDPDSPF